MIKQRLFTPGPTDVPPEVLVEMAKPIFHHRTSRFQEMFKAVNDGLKKLLFTSGDVLTLAGSGTAGMEAAMICTIPRDKKVLVAQGGKFAERWVKVGKVYGMQVDEVKVEWGMSIAPQLVQEKLATGQYGAVVVVHSETSTATACDLQGVSAVVRKTDAILLADCISSAGTLPIKMDEWGVDVVATGSQKALMLPPGLALVAVSPKAWALAEKIKAPALYLDLKAYRKSLADNDVPYTPAISLIRGLEVALGMIHKVGIETLWARTAVLSRACREAAKALGLAVYSKQPSDSVTGSQKALMLPPGLALVAVSAKAWANIDKIKAPSLYLDLKAYKKSIVDGDVPYTPAITLIRGLEVALAMIHKVGVERLWARTAVLARACREAFKAMGLAVYSRQPSDSVTGILYPPGVEDKQFRNKLLRDKYGCSVAGGQAELEGKMFRISHMGYVDPVDTIGLVAAIEYALAACGVKVEIGKGVAAAAKIIQEWA
jgi:aspartate aminotransferase-like enzyme